MGTLSCAELKACHEKSVRKKFPCSYVWHLHWKKDSQPVACRLDHSSVCLRGEKSHALYKCSESEGRDRLARVMLLLVMMGE